MSVGSSAAAALPFISQPGRAGQIETGLRSFDAVPVHRNGGVAELVFARCMVQHRRLGSQVEAMRGAMADAALLMGETLHRNGRLVFFGNSGAGVIGGLLAASMQVRLSTLARKPPLPVGLVAFSLEESEARPGEESNPFAAALARRGRSGDCAVVLSTSGESSNILKAIQTARDVGMTTVGLLGNNGGSAKTAVDVAVMVPERDPMRVYEAHLFAGHTLCRQLEWALRPPG